MVKIVEYPSAARHLAERDQDRLQEDKQEKDKPA